MFIELRVPADRFLTALRGRFARELVVALAEPITSQGLASSLFGSCGGGELWLDRIAVWQATLADYDGAGVVTVRQPFDVIVVSRTALEQNGAEASPGCWIGTITAVFTLQARLDAGVPSTCVEFVDLESDDVPPPVLHHLRQMANGFGSACEAVDLAELDDLFGGVQPEIRRVALAMSQDGTRLGVHIAFETVGSGLAGSRPLEEALQAGFDVRFTQFLGGQFTADTADQPWSLFVHAMLLQVAARRRARRRIMSRDEIRLLSGPSASFKVDSNGVPRMEVTFSVDAIDACLWTDGDIGIDAVTKASYTSPQENILEGRLLFEYDLYDSDVALCAGLAPLFGPLWLLDQIITGTDAGVALLGTVLVLGNIGLFVISPFMVSILSRTLAAEKVEEKMDPGAEWVRVRGNDDRIEYRSTSVFDLDAGDVGLLNLTSVVGRNDNHVQGIVLSGTITAAAEPRIPRLGLNVPQAFTVLFDDPCGAEPRLTAFYRIYVHPNGGVVAENGIRILEGTDPLDQYRPFLVVDSIGISINVPIDQIQPAYADAPYSAQLLIATSAGVRIITLPLLPILTAEEIAEQTEANAQWAPIHCDDWAVGHGFWKGSRFNPRWHVDPPPDEIVAVDWVQYWEVLISGLAPGDAVTFEDRERKVLARVSAWRGGRLAWEGVLPSDVSTRAGVSMYRGEIPSDDAAVARSLESRRKDQVIAIRQMMLLEQARIGVPGGIRGLALLQTDYGRQLTVADPDGVSVYALAQAQRPVCQDRLRLPGTLGVLGWQDGWVAWGRYGLAGPSGAPVECGHEGGVRALVAVRGTLLALTARGVYRVDRNLRLEELMVATPAQHMAVGRTTLALAEGEKVTFHRREGLRVGEVIGTVPLAACLSLTCEGTGDRYSVRGRDGARTVLDASGQVARQDPPTSRAAAGEIVARWRDHFAVTAIGGSSITFYRTGPARSLRR